MNNLPKISICLPTYNNGETIEECLRYIKSQNYPQNLIEIIVIDGNSSDETVNICKKHTDIILNNPYRVEEKGRVLGIKKSTGDIIGFVDADNFLTDNDFLQKIVAPFMCNRNVVFSEPKFYFSRPGDDKITAYISLIGGDDPIAVYLGLYERFCYFKNKWTDSNCEIILREKNYEILRLKDLTDMPPFGANGCFIKKDKLLAINYDPFIHTDVIYRLLKKDNAFSKTDTAIIHKQNGSLISFLKKKIRRGARNCKELKNREYYFNIKKTKAAALIIRSVLIFPLIFDSAVGYKNKKSSVWFWHPIITISTLFAYFYSLIKKYGTG